MWRSAVITGGSRGIGLAFAETLAAQGTNLLLVARDTFTLNATAERLRRNHRIQVETLAADLADEQAVTGLADRLETSAPDLLVNNVGGGSVGLFTDKPWEDIRFELRANLETTVRLMRAVLPAMREAKCGTVINVAAGNAFYPTPGGATYGAAKAAVVSLTEAVANEVRKDGVTVTAICPGFTPTDAQVAAGINRARVPRLLWTSPDKVAIAGLRAASRGKRVAFPSRLDSIGVILGRHAPRSLLLPVVAAGQRRLTKA